MSGLRVLFMHMKGTQKWPTRRPLRRPPPGWGRSYMCGSAGARAGRDPRRMATSLWQMKRRHKVSEVFFNIGMFLSYDTVILCQNQITWYCIVILHPLGLNSIIFYICIILYHNILDYIVLFHILMHRVWYQRHHIILYCLISYLIVAYLYPVSC